MAGPTVHANPKPTPDAPSGAGLVLLIEADDELAEIIEITLAGHFHSKCVERIASVGALAEVDLSRFDAVLCAARLPGADGILALRAIASVRADIPVIMIAGAPDIPAALEAVRAGASDVVALTPGSHVALPLTVEKNLALGRVRSENRRLQDALNESLGALQAKNDQLERAVASLEAMALTDELTGLANRRRLSERLDQMYAQGVRYGSDLACLMIDLDGFKSINDTLGHQRGDELLSLAGRIIAGSVRSSDVAARYGGDEFVILLPHTSWSTAATLGARLSARFQREAGKLGRVGLRCGMSIGVACLALSAPADGDQLLAQADNALYAAKQTGKSRLMVCGPDGVTALDPAALSAEVGQTPTLGPIRLG